MESIEVWITYITITTPQGVAMKYSSGNYHGTTSCFFLLFQDCKKILKEVVEFIRSKAPGWWINQNQFNGLHAAIFLKASMRSVWWIGRPECVWEVCGIDKSVLSAFIRFSPRASSQIKHLQHPLFSPEFSIRAIVRECIKNKPILLCDRPPIMLCSSTK